MFSRRAAPSKPRPFSIDTNEPLGNDTPSYVPLLQSVFGQGRLPLS